MKHYLSSGKPACVIAEHFGVNDKTFYTWIREFKADGDNSFKGKGIVKDSNEELLLLKRQLADVTMERDILKKAVAIFSNPK